MIYTLSQVALIAAAARLGWTMMGALIIAIPQLGCDFVAGYRRGRGK